MSGFEQRERIGRDKTRLLYSNYNLVESPNLSDSWDMSGCTTNIAGERNFFIEVKDRDVTSNDFETNILEWNKYRSLMQLASQYNAYAFYISFYQDGIAYVHNITNLKLSDLNLVVRKAPKTTCGNTEYIDKIFIELPFAGATKKKYINDIN